MAQGQLKVFAYYPYQAGLGAYNNSTDTFKLALLTDAIGDIDENQVSPTLASFNEASGGGQYSAGGNALPGASWNFNAGVTNQDFTDFSMNKGQGNPTGVKTALIINSTAGNHAINVIDLTTDGTTAIDVQNNDLNIQFNADGTFEVTVA